MHLPKTGLFFYSPPLTPIISKVDFIFHSICDSSMLKFAQGCGSVEEYKSEEIIQISHYYDPLKSSELHLRGLKEIMLLMLIKLAYRSIEDHIGYVELGHERSPGQGTLSQLT